MIDVLIVGGGAIGLCLADELLRGGARVTVLDKGPVGQEASWAGAGMLTCRPRYKATPGEADYYDLCGLSVKLHKEWSERLLSETGIDVGYRVCGAIELLAGSIGEASSRTSLLYKEALPDLPPEKEELRRNLDAFIATCNERGVRARKLDARQVRELEPQLCEVAGGIEFPDEPQVRNPWFVRALAANVRRMGGVIREGVEVADLDLVPASGSNPPGDRSVPATRANAPGTRVVGVKLKNGEKIAAGAVAICAGAWAGQLPALVDAAPVTKKIEPVRGQLLCYQADPKLAQRLLTYGNHYIVPRGDGVLLVGATHEKAGFEKKVTEAGMEELARFGQALLPALTNVRLLKAWSGLRPGMKGRHPVVGPVTKIHGLYVAGGHYRNGLTLAPATAELLAALILKKTPRISVKMWLPD